MIISAFAEAVRATTQPCTLLLIAPPTLAVIVTRGRWPPLVATLVGALLGGWLFIANTVALSDAQLRWSGALVAGALALLGAARFVPEVRRVFGRRVEAAIAGCVGFVATLWWRPCVGTQLGIILTDARRDGVVGELPAMTAYMLGAMVPVVVVALAIRAIDPPPRSSRRLVGGAALGALLLGGALALGRHDDLVTTLTRWTAT